MAEQAVQYQGLPFKAEGRQLQDMARGGATGIPVEQAQQQTQALEDIRRANEEYGTAGEAALGVLSGLTLGLGPGLLARGGFMDPNLVGAAETTGAYTGGDIAGTLLPALLSGGETIAGRGAVGGVRGLLGSAMRATPMGLLSTGSERLAMRLVPEGAGLMGRAASVPLRMATQGAVDGALINMGHYIGDSLIQNKPLAAEAMLASGLDGALFGGLIGGATGTVGSIGKLVTDKAAGIAGKAGGSERRLGQVARRLGMSDDAVAEAQASGGLKEKLKSYREVIDSDNSGVTYASGTDDIRGAAGRVGRLAETSRKEIVATLDREAGAPTGVGDRVLSRVDDEVLGKYKGTLLEKEATKAVRKLVGELGDVGTKVEGVKGPPGKPRNLEPPKEPKKLKGTEWAFQEDGKWRTGTHSEAVAAYEAEVARWKSSLGSSPEGGPAGHADSWQKWLTSRDALADKIPTLSGIQKDIATQTLSIIDRELRAAIEGAEESLKSKGLADKFAAATLTRNTARELEKIVGKKAASELLSHETTFTPRDLAVFGGMAAIGHPGTAAAWMAAKGLGRAINRKLEPAMAEMAYKASVGQRAMGAEANTRARIRGSLTNFFKSGGKAANTAYAERNERSIPKGKLTRKDYEEAASRTEQLVSQAHQQRVNNLVESLVANGYGQFAKALFDTNQRAVQYMQFNGPGGPAGPTRRSGAAVPSLRPQPAIKGLDLNEFKFLRIDRAVKDPFTLLDDLDKGSISRDAVQAVQYVYPEIHAQIVQETTQQIYEMKAAGEHLPMDKVTTLGIVLNSPVDSTLTPEFIAEVQSSMKSRPTSQEQPQQPTPGIAATPLSPGAAQLLPPTDQLQLS